MATRRNPIEFIKLTDLNDGETYVDPTKIVLVCVCLMNPTGTATGVFLDRDDSPIYVKESPAQVADACYAFAKDN